MCFVFFAVLRYSVYVIGVICGGLLVNTLYDRIKGEDVSNPGLKCVGYFSFALSLFIIQRVTTVALEREERRNIFFHMDSFACSLKKEKKNRA